MNKQTVQLPPAVTAKYELVDWTGGHTQHFGKWGKVSIKDMSLAKADILFKAKFPKLKLKEAKKTDKKSCHTLSCFRHFQSRTTPRYGFFLSL